jgi:hypothetical protein
MGSISLMGAEERREKEWRKNIRHVGELSRRRFLK